MGLLSKPANKLVNTDAYTENEIQQQDTEIR